MKCLSNLERIQYPKELVYNLVKLYTSKGKDFYYEDVLKQYMTQIVKRTVETDTLYATKLLKLNITEPRLKLLIKKNHPPKTPEEQVVANLKLVFEKIQSDGVNLELTSNEFLALAVTIFKGYHQVDFTKTYVKVQDSLIATRKMISKRQDLEDALSLYSNALENLKIEPTQAITNFYIDLLHMQVFDHYSDFISLIMCYAFLVSQRFNVFKYVSFFKAYTLRKEKWDAAVVVADYQWEAGYSKTADLNGCILDIMLDGYLEVQNEINDFNFDKNLRKIDNVESSIMKLGKTFTREDVRNKISNQSESTISRALKHLQETNKIASTGTGRSAYYIRIAPEEAFSVSGKQMSMFEFITEDDE